MRPQQYKRKILTQDMKKRNNKIITFDDVRDRIVEVRGKKAILDFAVAELYGVETREINQAVKNNPRKFPEGWVFELEKQEVEDLRSKILITNVSDNQADKDLQSKKSAANIADNQEDAVLRSKNSTLVIPLPLMRQKQRWN